MSNISSSTRRIKRNTFLMITDTALKIADSICEALIIDLFDFWSTSRQQEWLFITVKQIAEELQHFFAIPTIKRSIRSLEDKNVIISERLEGNNKKYQLNYNLINNWSDQNDPISDQNDPTSDQNDPTPRIKMIPPSDQNDPTSDQNDPSDLIYKKYINNNKKEEEEFLKKENLERLEKATDCQIEQKEEKMDNTVDKGGEMIKYTQEPSGTPKTAKIDPYFGRKSALQLQREQAARHATKDSLYIFNPAMEYDFYKQLTDYLKYEQPGLITGKAKAIAQAITQRLKRNEAIAKDLEYYELYNSGEMYEKVTYKELDLDSEKEQRLRDWSKAADDLDW